MDIHAKAVQSSYLYTKEGHDNARDFVRAHIPKYELHRALSDDNSTVLYDPGSEDVIIAYHGTVHPTSNFKQSMYDYKADAEIALGLHKLYETPRQREAQMKYERVRSLFPMGNIKVAGHSLGAMQSYYVATQNDLEGYHYSIGSGLFDTPINHTQRIAYKNDPKYKKQKIYHATAYNKYLGKLGEDPISDPSRFLPGRHYVVPVDYSLNKLKTHRLDNFYRLNDEL